MTSDLLCFDDWTLDPRSGELDRGGDRLRLQEQPLQILCALLERPGDVVTREELVARLWPTGVVDFDTGLNTAVRRLRIALRDDAEAPRYIETLPRRGYRFIGRLPPRPKTADADRTLRIGVTETPVTRGECLVVTHAPSPGEVGRRCSLQRDAASIGRDFDNDIVLTSLGVSRHHARIERRSDGMYIVDQDSTNGVLINDDRTSVTEALLSTGDEMALGDVILTYLGASGVEAQYQALLRRTAMCDGLTGLHRRSQFDEMLDGELVRARRHGRALSLLVIEIENFSELNARYGRLAGDSVLRGFAALLRKRVRPEDVLGRYDPERLCVLLPETTHEGAMRIGAALRTLAASSVFAAGRRELRASLRVEVKSLTDA